MAIDSGGLKKIGVVGAGAMGAGIVQTALVAGLEVVLHDTSRAQNYPRGPLDWAAWMGPPRVLETMSHLQSITGSDRYRPSLWLRRRAQLGLPIHLAD